MSPSALLAAKQRVYTPLEQNILVRDLEQNVSDPSSFNSGSHSDFRELLISRSSDWSAILNSNKDSKQCEFYLEQIGYLENEFVHAQIMQGVFHRGQKDNVMIDYYSIRMWIAAYYLRRLAQIFENGYEGGGGFDSRAIQCIWPDRQDVLNSFVKRDLILDEIAHSSMPSSLSNPLLVEQGALSILYDQIDRRGVVKTALKMATYTFAFLKGAQILRTGYIALFGSQKFAAILTLLSTLPPSFYLAWPDEDLMSSSLNLADERDPQSLWLKTMARIQHAFANNPSEKTILSFHLIQDYRLKMADSLQN